MAVSYDKLWKLLIDKKMSAAELRRIAEIAPNTMTRMRKNQEVTMSVLEKICDVLDADFGDIVEYMGSQQTNKQEVRRGAEK
ncbi:MAG: helix-turn-helix transcriptional regulator [Akkermansia muciniphila]|uniref:Transcriptional regulator n=2 Tax=Akkermansiaceae TaxID=1647988 RepID=A0AAX0WJL5_9BACT|nr:helix-turn-helix transcriptional regulator [Akkermansia muciniphila]PND02817.1 transcriptional regulator [Akkermansia muciniphila]